VTTIGPIIFRAGDRICWKATGDDGLPLRRYGFISGRPNPNGRVVVMFDGDLKGETVVAVKEIEPVSIMTVDLVIDDLELLNDPTLRQALVGLWSSEAELAGLIVENIVQLGTGVRDVTGLGYALAELHSAGELYVLRAVIDAEYITVRADVPRRFERQRR
jgi:hypothetical protein